MIKDYYKEILSGDDLLLKWIKTFLQIVLFLACICYFTNVPGTHQIGCTLSVLDRSLAFVVTCFLPLWAVICCYLIVSDN